jgi:type IV fimbrial biogenesis protein FimT
MNNTRTRGFTALELLIVMGLASLLLLIAVPSLRTFSLDGRRTVDINGFVVAVQLARSEAAKRGQPVVLCQSEDGRNCGDNGLRYGAGWMVFVNEDDVRPPQRNPAEIVLYRYLPQTRGSITANRRLFEFRPFGWRSTNGTVTFCDERGAAAARAVIISYTGRPRTSDIGPGNRPLICAALP